MQRTLTIASIVIVLLGLGIGAYFYFFAGSASITVVPGGSASFPTAADTSVPTQDNLDSTGDSAIGTPIAAAPRLVQISAGPVVPGEVVLNIQPENASSTPEVAVRYLERQSGNVFSYSPSTQKITRINNKTIPGIQSASWLPDGSSAFVRYLSGNDFSTINTYALAATSSEGSFLAQNLSDIAVSATGALTTASGVNGSSISLANADGSHSSTLFTTPLTSLRVSFAGENQYLAFSKASATLSGYAFLVNAKGRFSRVAGPLPGLVALASPSGAWVLASYTQGGTLRTELIDTVKGTALPIPVATIADKCVWAADESTVYCGIPMNPPTTYAYPDDWYQGAVAFSDRIWKIDVENRYAQLVLDFSQANKGSLDAESLAIDPAKTTLVFVNKNDGSLWSYSL